MVADAATTARESLDRVEKEIKPGHGRADLFVFARRDAIGAGGEVSHRYGEHTTLFARGWIGRAWDRTDGEIIAGLRGTW